MRIELIIGLAFALLIAGCSSKPASQGAASPGAAAPTSAAASSGAVAPTSAAAAQSPGAGAQPPAAAAKVAPLQAPAPAPGAPPTGAAKPSEVAAPGAAHAPVVAPVAANPSADKSATSTAKAPAAAAKAPAPQAANAAPTAAKSTAPPLDLTSLTQRLKDTNAIGVMSKIALKNQVDDLLDQFRAFYQGKIKTTLAELRRPYDLLVLKVLSLLQDSDPGLASAIVASREAIWGILADPKKFATVS